MQIRKINSIEEMAASIAEDIKKRTGKNVKVETVIKNNNTELTAICILEDGVNISPSIYINKFFDLYTRDEISYETIIEDVLKIYEDNKFTKSVDLKEFMDYEKIKDRIVFKLINRNKNEKFLSDVPHIDFLDLSLILQCVMYQGFQGNATVIIREAHKKLWNVTDDELCVQALRNTPLIQKYDLINIKDILGDHLQDMDMDDEEREIIMGAPLSFPMYVLSNKGRLNGAGCLLYPDLMEKFSKAIDDHIYIIPSSIHETILIPSRFVRSVDNAKEMIHQVNTTVLNEEEFLSDNLYFYDREKQKFSIA